MKNSYKYILWDFDGTVMDTYPGIASSVKKALTHYGIYEENEAVLRTFIGPPLRVSFPAAYGFDEETTENLIELYRKYYHAGALYECVLFDGVKEAADLFREKGYKQYIASSKPEHACIDILRHKGLENLFDGVFGATEDGRIDTKTQVLEEAFRVLGEDDKSLFVLIGDTKYDVIGAKEAGIDCIGITYGNGRRSELEEYGAAAVLDTMQEVADFITGQGK